MILSDSVANCWSEKGMEFFTYCLLPSHVHLIFSDDNEGPSGLLRVFKKHTTKALIKAI